jgi:hypothetical protein
LQLEYHLGTDPCGKRIQNGIEPVFDLSEFVSLRTGKNCYRLFRGRQSALDAGNCATTFVACSR